MSAIVLPSEENTVAADFGLKAMKKTKNAIPSQVRTFLTMGGFLLHAGTVNAAPVLTVSVPSLPVNRVCPKPRYRYPGSGLRVQAVPCRYGDGAPYTSSGGTPSDRSCRTTCSARK